jgi:uncharacterized RDD family membrane protein YckC
MKISHQAVVVGLVLSLVGPFFLHFPYHTIGFTYHEGSDGTEVTAGSHPAVIVWAVFVIATYFLLVKQRTLTESVGVAGLGRRFLAFLIDFIVVLVATSCIGSVFPLIAEARRVGRFEWGFQRDYSASTDSIFAFLVLLSFIELFFYFAYPLTWGKQTIGEYVVRVKVTPPFGDGGRFTWGAAAKRVSYSLLGICAAWHTLSDKVDQNGQTRYDRATNCTVSLVEYKREDADSAI